MVKNIKNVSLQRHIKRPDFNMGWTITYVHKLQYQVIEITTDIVSEMDFLLMVFDRENGQKHQ